MAKREKERPGVVIRFRWMNTLDKLSNTAKARFLMTCLQRGQNLLYQIDLDGLDVSDSIRLETLWEQAAPEIDADGEGWVEGIFQRKYAGYCSGCARKGEEPMSIDAFREWYNVLQERAPEAL